MIMEKEQSELQALIIKLFPPHDYGEDSNVEELYNRCTDLESEAERLQAENKELREALKNSLDYVREGYDMLQDTEVSAIREAFMNNIKKTEALLKKKVV